MMSCIFELFYLSPFGRIIPKLRRRCNLKAENAPPQKDTVEISNDWWPGTGHSKPSKKKDLERFKET